MENPALIEPKNSVGRTFLFDIRPKADSDPDNPSSLLLLPRSLRFSWFWVNLVIPASRSVRE